MTHATAKSCKLSSPISIFVASFSNEAHTRDMSEKKVEMLQHFQRGGNLKRPELSAAAQESDK